MLVQSFEKSVPSGTKRCTRCKKYKREFKPDSRRKDGLSSWCKDCVRETCREYARKRRAADPEAERAYQNAWRLANLDKARARVRRAAKKRIERSFEAIGQYVCQCCETTERLEFDHILPVRQGRRAARDRATEVLAAPHLFQVLCRQCNRWKDVGPNCPCKYWDSISSNWREAREK